MDVDELQNAAPTIRDATDIPTRLGKPVESITATNDLMSALNKPVDLLLDPFSSWQPLTTSTDISQPAPVPSSPTSLSSAPSSPPSESDFYEPIDEQEIFDLISTISDPEHPLTLGSLSVVNLGDVHLKPLGNGLTLCTVEITPTITHCSLATVIGLGVRVRLEQSLPARFRVDVRVKEGTHSTGDQVNKQLADKERVAAALENAQLMDVLMKMMETCR